jgi:hypothetical protein
MVRDHVLGLAYELHELADSTVTSPELADDVPSQRVAQQAEDPRRLCRRHTAM